MSVEVQRQTTVLKVSSIIAEIVIAEKNYRDKLLYKLTYNR